MSDRGIPYPLLWICLACSPVEMPGVEIDESSSSTGTSGPPQADVPTEPMAGTTGIETTTTGTTTEMDTTGVASTGAAAETSTGESLCGNAVLDAGEACDLGWQDNSDKGYCKTDCTEATCGDGDLWVGVEVCDEGPGGNLGDYGGCMPDCKGLAPYCGDGQLDPGEGCDAGDANGTDEHAEGFVACSATCDLEAYRVFITSAMYDGKLGGLTGADQKCQSLAQAAGWPAWSHLRAWLSDGVTAAPARVAPAEANRPYALVSGERIADDLAALIAVGPGDGIALDELGMPWVNAPVWTNTAGTGEPVSAVHHCMGWLSASADSSAQIGLNAVPKLPDDVWKKWSEDRLWTSFLNVICEKEWHLYCFET